MRMTERTQDSMKAAILSAAEQAFSHFGYEGTSFRAISALSGAKRALILYHFKNKEGLWRETVLKVKDDFLVHFNAVYAQTNPQSDDEKGRRLTIAFLTAAREVPAYGRILLQEGIMPNDRIAWMTEQMKPDQIVMPVYDDPDYNEASFMGIVRQIQSGALLYLGNMGPLMAMEAPAGDTWSKEPLNDDSIERVADYMLALVKMRVKEIKLSKVNP